MYSVTYDLQEIDSSTIIESFTFKICIEDTDINPENIKKLSREPLKEHFREYTKNKENKELKIKNPKKYKYILKSIEKINSCLGCRDGILANQEAHMDIGGCLHSYLS